MKFQVTAGWLQQHFSSFDLDFVKLEKQLLLDMGHLLLLRDCFKEWGNVETPVVVVMFYLIHEVNSGSLCIDFDGEEFRNYLQKHQQSFDSVQQIDWEQFTLAGEQVLKKADNYLYFIKYWQSERSLEAAVLQLLQGYDGLSFTAEQVNQVVRNAVNDLTFDSIENKQLQAVVTCLLQPFSIISGGPGTGKTTIMSTVLRCLLALGYQVENVVLTAPTGRAANRMTESLQATILNALQNTNDNDHKLLATEAQTLHRLLGAHPKRGGFTYGSHNKLSCQVLVVDEASMVDVKLMKQIFQAIEPNCRVILLGDQFQLPSVDSGAVLADLMPPVDSDGAISETMFQNIAAALKGFKQSSEILQQLKITNEPERLSDCFTVLEVSKRSQSNIADISELVRLGQSDQMLTSELWHQFDKRQLANTQMTTLSGVYQLKPFSEQQHWLKFCLSWIKAHYFNPKAEFEAAITAMQQFDEKQLQSFQQPLDVIFSCINSNRILTLVNDTMLGSLFLNSQICEMMRQQLAVKGFHHHFHGSVVMFRRNDVGLKLFNGDVGILLISGNGQLRVVVPVSNGYRSHSIHVVPDFTSAYAMTVHKSQGSEFAHILLPLPTDETHRLLSREIVYTGLTRAKQSVIVYGSNGVIKTAISNKSVRHSGLKFWYNKNS